MLFYKWLEQCSEKKETNSSSDLNLFWFTKEYAVCESVYMCEIACFRAQKQWKMSPGLN